MNRWHVPRHNFGDIAREFGYIQQQDIERALACPNKRIGEALVCLGRMTYEQVAKVVWEQAKRRRGTGRAIALVRHQQSVISGVSRDLVALAETEGSA